MNITRNVVLVVGISLALAACATQPIPDAFDPPGFFSGLLHGAIAPFALVGSLFSEFRIYAFPNSGWLYDLGFLLGLAIIWGGAAASA
jgi:hypothetical protein